MSDLDVCTAALGHANVRAFLRVLRAGESQQSDDAYRLINGGALFPAPPWRHPWHGISTASGAKACGAYQFLGTTWAEMADRLGLGEDFSPPSQDAGAVGDIAFKRHALAEVERGDLARAFAKLGDEWVFIKKFDLDRARKVFAQYGGQESAQTAAEQPTSAPAPSEAPTTIPPAREAPVGAGLILGLVQAALGAFAPLAQQKIQAELGRHTDEATAGAVAQHVMDAIQTATGKADPIAATAAITARDVPPTTVQAAQDDALARLDRMAPVLDKLAQWDKQTAEIALAGRDAAQARGARDKVDIGPMLTYAGVLLVGLTLLLLLAGMGVQMWFASDHKPDTTLIALIGPLLGVVYKVFSELYAYRFDGTPKSNAADAMMTELAKK